MAPGSDWRGGDPRGRRRSAMVCHPPSAAAAPLLRRTGRASRLTKWAPADRQPPNSRRAGRAALRQYRPFLTTYQHESWEVVIPDLPVSAFGGQTGRIRWWALTSAFSCHKRTLIDGRKMLERRIPISITIPPASRLCARRRGYDCRLRQSGKEKFSRPP